MIVSDPDHQKGYHRKVVVQCENCKKHRGITWHAAKSSTKHICRSCSCKLRIQKKPETCSAQLRAMKEAIVAKAKAGRGRIQSGYRQLYLPDHPNASGQYVFEHNFVIEKETGIYPDKNEIVHHINGNKLDNRIENLFACKGNTKKESAQIHNNCHYSAEKLTLSLVDIGAVEFKDGEYKLSSKLAALVADIFGDE
jgi:hypothetical protein